MTKKRKAKTAPEGAVQKRDTNPAPRAGRRVQITFEKPSLTQQQFKDKCDINQIVDRYQETGLFTHVNNLPPQYGDATAPDFHTAMNFVIQAQESFDAMPAKLRARFGNDPALFLEFMQDPANLDEAREMGLVATKEQTTPLTSETREKPVKTPSDASEGKNASDEAQSS